ncbi:hypothetical protein GBA52_003843 [Prunus armeniaca]|nr:hypothetical protein GBA52_003843 [Prunus armeniaca]
MAGARRRLGPSSLSRWLRLRLRRPSTTAMEVEDIGWLRWVVAGVMGLGWGGGVEEEEVGCGNWLDRAMGKRIEAEEQPEPYSVSDVSAFVKVDSPVSI